MQMQLEPDVTRVMVENKYLWLFCGVGKWEDIRGVCVFLCLMVYRPYFNHEREVKRIGKHTHIYRVITSFREMEELAAEWGILYNIMNASRLSRDTGTVLVCLGDEVRIDSEC